MSYFNMSPNRYLCEVLEEMRKQLALLNVMSIPRYISITAMLIEEAQTMGNRMEGHLSDVHDIDKMLVKRAKLKKEIKLLVAKKELLGVGEEDD